MSNRNKNAVAAQQGACNPIPMIRALQDGVEELKAEDPDYFGKVRTDPALRLIVHQLAHIMGVNDFSDYIQACSDVGMPE